MNLTTKQRIILKLIADGNPDGPIDLDQLIERLSYDTSKQSMQFSIRALVAKGLIERSTFEVRRGRNRRLFTMTPLGTHWCINFGLIPKPGHQAIDGIENVDVVAVLP